MRKFLAVFCSIALVASSFTVTSSTVTYADEVNDAYKDDGDIIENPWTEEFSTEAPTEKPTVAPVKITSQPSNVTAEVGDSVSISVTATGTGLTYQWQLSSDGGSYWANTTATGYNTSAITLTIAEKHNGRKYRCIVTDSAGNKVTSSVATVTVKAAQEKLEITSQPKSITTTVGSVEKISVTATGTGLKYQWQLSSDGGSYWANTTATGYNTSAITLTIAEKHNGRKYRCVVTDSAGNKMTSSVATVTVKAAQEKLEITSQPKSITTTVGSVEKISVTATGTGLKYQWQVSSDGGASFLDTTATGYNTSAITLTIAEKHNGRKYRCIVKDSAGNRVTSSVATVTVGAPLAITGQPKSITTTVGSTEKISVTATGTGLKYQWQVSTDGGSYWANTTATGYNTSAITLTIAEKHDGRKYRCIITDSAGNKVTSSVATVTVGAALAITGQPKSITTTVGSTEKISVTATGTGLKYQWQVSTDGGSYWANTTATGYNTSAITLTIAEKHNGRQYRCIVTDSAGNKITSSVATVTIK